jgi:hypothetical protein
LPEIFKTLLIALSFVFFIIFDNAWAQEYVGSETCGECHQVNYDYWQESGHHHSLKEIDETEPNFPFQYHSGISNVPDPPTVGGTQLTWDQVSYVAGGYYRGAVFSGEEGYLITGGNNDVTQWNVWDQEWVEYHPNEQLPLDCAECHATGYDPAGHQGGLQGITGTWVENGVGCEGCHGPDS